MRIKFVSIFDVMHMHILDGSDGIAPEEEEAEELLSSQLAQMGEMGFSNWQENLRALLKSGADVEKAVEAILEKAHREEGQ
jgi:uncharacterized UBP type Zn finger protein